MVKAVYAGSFDPLTVGHMSIIERSAKIFDDLVVVVGTSADKKEQYMFSAQERMLMIEESVRHLPNVKVAILDNGFVVKYAADINAKVLVRGVRSPDDFYNESLMDEANSLMDSTITTVFMRPPKGIEHVSSSFVKRYIVGPDGWQGVVRKYVPESVAKALEVKIK